ncbi:MAG: thiamine phosphate synthase, partial [Rhizobiales bacterium]|nr:thiamine phosphate synthase [Hyphomicrobiales bacterium]
ETCRKTLGDDFIIGAYVGSSKHDAMLFGELNADYVAFGPDYIPDIADKNNQEILALANWWQEMFQLPSIAYLDATENVDQIEFINAYPDFVALLPNFWEIDKPEEWLNQLCNKSCK